MLTSKFPAWVDLGGMELLEMQGQTIPGLYAKFPSDKNTCVLFNFTIAGILINPSIMLITRETGALLLNNYIRITSGNVFTIPSLVPSTLALEVTANGEYTPPTNQYYNFVDVDVEPALEEGYTTENGIFIPTAYGFSSFNVNVPTGLVELTPLYTQKSCVETHSADYSTYYEAYDPDTDGNWDLYYLGDVEDGIAILASFVLTGNSYYQIKTTKDDPRESAAVRTTASSQGFAGSNTPYKTQIIELTAGYTHNCYYAMLQHTAQISQTHCAVVPKFPSP